MIDGAVTFAGVLLPGERILWQGTSIPRRALFSSADVFLIPFSIMWAGFAIFWEAGVLASGAPGFFALWGVPFVLAGAYFVVGRFVVAYRIAQTAQYAVTDRRVLIVSGLLRRSTTSLDLRDLPFVQLRASSDGVGDIAFAASPYGAFFSGAQAFPWSGAAAVPMFRAIPNAAEVQATIERARDEVRRA